MNTTYNRRKFLKSSFLGLGALLFTGSPLHKLAANNDVAKTNVKLSDEVHNLHKQAKEHFYKKEYVQAESIYLQLIKQYPNKVEFCDGYAKVLGAQQRHLEIAELYRIAVNNNDNNPFFKHRLANSLKTIYKGNHKAEKEFTQKYGANNLLIYAAELLFAAIAIKQTKGFMLDLRDIPEIAKTKNERLNNGKDDVISLPNELIETILTKTAVIENKWNKTRNSKNQIYNTDFEDDTTPLKTKKKRILYTEKEIKQRKEHQINERKKRWTNALQINIKENKPGRVDRLGYLILDDDINDTQTIGRLKRYYKRNKYHQRLLTLDRYLYVRNKSNSNALALASTLTKHGKDSNAIAESNELLISIQPYLNTLGSIHIASYYITLSRNNIVNSKRAQARQNLLTGLNHFAGKGGVSFTLIENYVNSYTGNNRTAAINILKALCKKTYARNNDAVWSYVDKHLEWIKEKPLSEKENAKYLIALSKLQKKTNSSEFNETISEIERLTKKS